jgi:hypothetical protein
MPITLGCPSCGKRFRARDESAGKRVKCPYCAAAVPVPTAEEAAAAGAPTSVIPPTGPAAAAPVHAPPDRNPFSGEAVSAPAAPAAAAAIPRRAEAKPKPAPVRPAAAKPVAAKTAEERAAAGWKKARAGLCWVLFGLFWLTIPGFVGFGKLIYARSGNALPEGAGWVSIPGYVNDENVPNAIRMTKAEQLDVALYAVPVLLGGLCLTFGRLTAGAAPRSSGAGGLFACSGLFTLLGLAALVTAAACDKLLFRREYEYAGLAFLILGGVAEFWFLTGLTASGLALKRPSVARSVGTIGFLVGLAAFIPTLGWLLYTNPEWNLRPRPLTEDWNLYEQAALMIGWLLLIGVYWRAVRGVRVAIRDSLSAG